MSKIGRRPIPLDDVKVEIKGNEIHYSGKNDSGVYVLPEVLAAEIIDDGKALKIMCENRTAKNNELWGLHRALLANKIQGARKEFEKTIQITGLGYKGAVSGDKVVFSLGKSHKIDFSIPKDITIQADKTGQTLTVKGYDKQQVGQVCSRIVSFRPPEPYKGTGIKLAGETILRKAGKTKA